MLKKILPTDKKIENPESTLAEHTKDSPVFNPHLTISYPFDNRYTQPFHHALNQSFEKTYTNEDFVLNLFDTTRFSSTITSSSHEPPSSVAYLDLSWPRPLDLSFLNSSKNKRLSPSYPNRSFPDTSIEHNETDKYGFLKNVSRADSEIPDFYTMRTADFGFCPDTTKETNKPNTTNKTHEYVSLKNIPGSDSEIPNFYTRRIADFELPSVITEEKKSMEEAIPVEALHLPASLPSVFLFEEDQNKKTSPDTDSSLMTEENENKKVTHNKSLPFPSFIPISPKTDSDSDSSIDSPTQLVQMTSIRKEKKLNREEKYNFINQSLFNSAFTSFNSAFTPVSSKTSTTSVKKNSQKQNDLLEVTNGPGLQLSIFKKRNRSHLENENNIISITPRKRQKPTRFR